MRATALPPVAPRAAGAPGARLPVVDLLKAVGCQLIVLHHLAFYGPMSDAAARLAPGLFDALAQHARWAVQVFLVVGGYLAARSLAPQGRWRPGLRPIPAILERYARLVLPLAAVLVLAIVASAVARQLMTHASISAPPTAGQVIAHLLLLQDLLGFEALSAGVWYVAIDFQLFALLVLILVLADRLPRRAGGWPALAPWIVMAGVAVSAMVVNRESAWDVAAPYFFAAYGLGALAAWVASGEDRPARWAVTPAFTLAFLLAIAVVGASLWIDWRPRLALAAGIALLLVLAARRAALRVGGAVPGLVVAWLGGRSYSIFLVHFPVCLVVNGVFTRFVAAEPLPQALGIAVAWASSVAAGALFHRAVEQPAMAWISARRGQEPAGPSGLRAG